MRDLAEELARLAVADGESHAAAADKKTHISPGPPTLPAALEADHPTSALVPSAVDNVLIETSDGVLLPCSLSFLAAHSSFFADLTSLPLTYTPATTADTSPSGESAQLPERCLIPLPSATSAGLKLVLALLHGPPLALDLPACKDTLDMVQAIRDISEIGDAYDFPKLPAKLYKLFEADDIFWRFAIAAAMGHEAQVARLSRWILAHDIDEMSPSALRLLERSAPSYLARLRSYHATYGGCWRMLERNLVRQRITFNGSKGSNDFIPRCYGKWSFDSCGPSGRGEDFMKMRERVAKAFYRNITANDGSSSPIRIPSTEGDILPFVAERVDCRRCATRLAKTFMDELRNPLYSDLDLPTSCRL